MKTKEKILKEALFLFSDRGFHAVSVRDIAKAVGIKESSLYNHFKNKQDIFDSIVDIQWENAKAYFREKELPFAPEEKKDVFIEWDFDRLSEKVLSVFSFFFENEENVRYRRLLILSQYEYPRAKEIYIKLYRNYMLEFQSSLFLSLMEAGVLEKRDPDKLALEFYGPVFLLLHTCTGLEEAKPKFVEHLRQFVEVYGKKEESR